MPLAMEDATTANPVAIEVAVGEALVRQSSGRHRAQAAVGISVAVPVRGVWGVAFEAVGTGVNERSAELSLDQYLLRPAALATATFARPIEPVVRKSRRGHMPGTSRYLAFDLGLGPAAIVTLASWDVPGLGALWVVEPGVRGRAALALGIGPHARIRLQGGFGWRPSGTDHDYLLGAAWAF